MRILATFFLVVLLSSVSTAQWVQTAGPDGINIVSAASTSGGLAFVSASGDIYRHNGASWIKLTSVPSAGKLGAIDDIYFLTRNQRSYRSSDEGKTWTQLNILGTITGNAAKLYNVTNDSLFTSIDKGATWQFIDTMTFFTQSITPHKNFLLTVSGWGPQLLRSSDGGVEWSNVTTPPVQPENFNTFIIEIIADGSDLFALLSNGEIFKSTDDGDTWAKALDAPDTTTSQYQHFIKAGDVFWVETAIGIFVWDGMNWGMPFSGYASLIAASSDEATVKTYEGLFRIFAKEDKLDILTQNFLNTSVYGMTAINSTVYSYGNGLHRTTDLGNTWTKVSSLTPYTIVSDQTYLYGFTNEGMQRSTDDGLTWLPFATPRDETWQDITSITTDGSTLYLSYGKTFGEHGQTNWVSGGMLRSTDHGATWRTINNGLPATIETHVPVHQIVVHEGTLYCATLEGLFRSQNDGEFWVPFNEGIEFQNFKSGVVTTGGNDLYFSYYNDYYRLENGMWMKLPKIDTSSTLLSGYTSALGDSLFVTTYTYDPLTESAIYKNWVFNGSSWVDMNPVAPEGVVLNAFIRVGNTYMSGSMHHSVWRITPTQSVDPSEAQAAISVYPNPAADQLRISSVEGTQIVTIYDLLGRVMLQTSINTAAESVNVSSLLPGTYVLEITGTNGFRHQLRFTKK